MPKQERQNYTTGPARSQVEDHTRAQPAAQELCNLCAKGWGSPRGCMRDGRHRNSVRNVRLSQQRQEKKEKKKRKVEKRARQAVKVSSVHPTVDGDL